MAKVEVTMPKMGESITEGTVIVWHKQPGDRVELDEALLEIGTDKVDTEVPSPAEGVLKEILVEEGDTVDVGTVLAVLETEVEAGGEDAEAEPPAAEQEAESAAVESEEPEGESSPAAVESEEQEGEPSPAAVESASAAAAETDEPDETEHVPVSQEPAQAASKGGDVTVVMPKMGESITEGTVITWHKQPGDRIELDETLLEIGTDKVDTEVPSPAEGVLREILVQEGDTVDVGTALAVIGTEEAAAETVEAPVRPVEPAQAEAPAPAPRDAAPAGDGAALEMAGEPAGIERKGSDGRFFSPLVRSIAEKEGLSMKELESISGSGREGRVTKEDVMSYLQSRSRPEREPAPDREARPAPDRPAAPPSPAAQGGYEGRVEIIEMDRMRQIIADHMVRSKATSAHVTSFAEADVTNLVRLRERHKQSFLGKEGIKLTYTPFFIHAVVEALRAHPILNASVDERRIVIKKDYHIGIAVAIGKKGLVAPVVRDAGQKNLTGLAHSAADLAGRARNKQLQPDELQGGTFTLTNIGSLGSLMGTPIINQPQVAILAVGAIKKRPVVVEDANLGDIIAIRHMMYVSLSYDHRVIDGAMGASFLQTFVRTVEGFDQGQDL